MKFKALIPLSLITITLTSCNGARKITTKEALAVAQDIAMHDVTEEVNSIERFTYTSESKIGSSGVKLVDRFDFVNLYSYRETVDLPRGIKKEWCYKKDNKYYNVINSKGIEEVKIVTEEFLKAKLDYMKEKYIEDVTSVNSQLCKYIEEKQYDDRVDEYYSEGDGSLKIFQKSEKGDCSFEISIVNYLPVYSNSVYSGDIYTSSVDTTKCELIYPDE